MCDYVYAWTDLVCGAWINLIKGLGICMSSWLNWYVQNMEMWMKGNGYVKWY